jgi:hypothetical protein
MGSLEPPTLRVMAGPSRLGRRPAASVVTGNASVSVAKTKGHALPTAGAPQRAPDRLVQSVKGDELIPILS